MRKGFSLTLAVCLVAGLACRRGSGAGPSDSGTDPNRSTAVNLTGRWVGRHEETKTFVAGPHAGQVCPTSWMELTVDFVHTGTSLTGIYRLGGGMAFGPCGETRGNTVLTPVLQDFPLSGTASVGAVTFRAGAPTLTGNYSATNLEVTGTYTVEPSPDRFFDRWILTRQ